MCREADRDGIGNVQELIGRCRTYAGTDRDGIGPHIGTVRDGIGHV